MQSQWKIEIESNEMEMESNEMEKLKIKNEKWSCLLVILTSLLFRIMNIELYTNVHETQFREIKLPNQRESKL